MDINKEHYKNKERDLEIYEIRINSDRTLKSIGNQYNLTPVRIRQIVEKEIFYRRGCKNLKKLL